MIVEIQLLGAVVVGEIDIGPAVAVEIGRGGGKGPARAADAHLVGHVLELAVAKVVKEQILTAVGGELEAVVHDPGAGQVPQVDVASEVRGHVKIEQAVAIIVEPDGAVAVHPAVQACRLGDVLEMVTVEILVEREVSVAIDEHVFAAVVVEIAPDSAHRDAFARLIEIGQASTGGDILEGAITLVSIKRVGRAEVAVGEIEIGPAVAIKIRD